MVELLLLLKSQLPLFFVSSWNDMVSAVIFDCVSPEEESRIEKERERERANDDDDKNYS